MPSRLRKILPVGSGLEKTSIFTTQKKEKKKKKNKIWKVIGGKSKISQV